MRIDDDAKFLVLMFVVCIAGGFIGIALGVWVML